MRKLGFLAAISGLLSVGLLGCGPAPRRNAIKVGEFWSLTGSTATFGQSSQKGSDLARDEINARGGVLGKPLEVITYDDAGKPEEAALAVTRLIEQDGVKVIIGEVASSRTLAAAPIAQRARVPMISPASTNPAVTKKGDYIFRACFTDTFQGQVCAKFAAQKGWKRAAILRDTKNDYSVGLADSFIAHFGRERIVADESYNADDRDFKAQLVAIKAKNPEVLFVPGYYTEVALIAAQARELGLDAVLLGGDGWDAPELVEIAGRAIEGGCFSNHYSIEDPNPRVHAFVRAFRARYKAAPDAMAALAYDTVYIVADAIRRAGTTEGPAVRDALARTQGFVGVTGIVTMGRDRDPVKSAVILQIRDGKQRLVEVIQP